MFLFFGIHTMHPIRFLVVRKVGSWLRKQADQIIR